MEGSVASFHSPVEWRKYSRANFSRRPWTPGRSLFFAQSVPHHRDCPPLFLSSSVAAALTRSRRNRPQREATGNGFFLFNNGARDTGADARALVYSDPDDLVRPTGPAEEEGYARQMSKRKSFLDDAALFVLFFRRSARP